MKVAIVCDWLTGIGGAERVVLELHRMFPEAPIYTSQYNPKAIDWFKNADVRVGWLQKLPKSTKKFLPVLRAKYFEKLDLSEYDLVISSSGAEAKGIKVREDATHICYCHAPTHYYWSRYDDYIKHPGFGLLNPVARLGLKALVGRMRSWDYNAAQRPDHMIANSQYTKQEIKKYYGRQAEVIHPPVDLERFKPMEKTIRNGFLIAGRQTPYKRFDLAVEACSELNVYLKVIGDGPDHNKLTKISGPRVIFLGRVAENELPRHFAQAEAFIFPGIDDFGIVAVEALAAGTPVIAFKDGGALDYINSNKNGVFFEHQSAESLAGAISKFLERPRPNPKRVAKSAENFSPKVFRKNLRKLIDTRLDKSKVQ